jgi:hypothetical protein
VAAKGHVGKVTRGHGHTRGPEAQRLGGTGRAVQRCKPAYGLCKSAKVAYESIEYGLSSIGRGNASGGGNG